MKPLPTRRARVVGARALHRLAARLEPTANGTPRRPAPRRPAPTPVSVPERDVKPDATPEDGPRPIPGLKPEPQPGPIPSPDPKPAPTPSPKDQPAPTPHPKHQPDPKPPPAPPADSDHPPPLPGVASDLLAVADRLANRELARRIHAVVARLPGIATISPDPGTPFDPAAHRWSETRRAAGPEQYDRIADVLEPGFRETPSRRVLAPARVAVYDIEEDPHE
ncbi:hypothetical protein ABZX40_21180 [Streptomyces sp. NPDC004610]|uniref:hypothetical protein n=1 Tax=unclassified Streptomyces TaxID=2593676 RepID=UPI0033A13D86